ncbi:hypothetical protein BKA65DRAFT_473192 [Rhexocercosporidium sp. MPI-PUGE-AT-0058]|nr:hypothetical protein BKA65DRAFT_473192 [Rhexocercosporidium sp. MPI-PUGE-AT-0058]
MWVLWPRDRPPKKEGQQCPEFHSKERDATERRMILCKRASKELKLKRSTTANTADEEVSSQETGSRMRAREIADADPENLHQSRQRRTEQDDRGATVAISSGSSYQAPGTEDVATGIATPAHFGMSSTNALIPTHHTIASLLSHCDEPQGEVLDTPRKRRRVGSLPPYDENRGFIVTPEAPAGVNLQVDNARTLDSPFSQQSVRTTQGGAAEETRLGGAKAQVACGMKIARMAEVDKLEIPLGGYLFERMKASRMRHQEKERRCMRFTDTVRLHVAYREGEDIKLEIWLCASIRNDVSQATISSAEGLRNILGNYLFEAMKASNWRKEQEKEGTYDFRGAFSISFLEEQSDSDCKVEVLLGSKMGLDFYQNAFP